MFGNKAKGSVEQGAEEKTIKAFLGAGSEFEGRMTFNESTRIDGSFRGEICSDNLLIIGAEANLQADVTVGSLIVCGRFKGNIKAHTKVELRAPAEVDGNIQTPSFSVEDGVVFNGAIEMTSV